MSILKEEWIMFKGYTKQQVIDYAKKHFMQVFLVSETEIVLNGGYVNNYCHCQHVYFDKNNIVKGLAK